MQRACNDLCRKLFSKTLGFHEHLYQPPLGGLHYRREQFRFWFHFATASTAARRNASRSTGSSTRSSEAIRRGPFRAQQAIRKAPHVRHQEIEGGEFSGCRGAIHLPRSPNQIVQVGGRFASNFLYASSPCSLRNLSGSAPPGSARSGRSNSFSATASTNVRWRLGLRCRIVVHDDRVSVWPSNLICDSVRLVPQFAITFAIPARATAIASM